MRIRKPQLGFRADCKDDYFNHGLRTTRLIRKYTLRDIAQQAGIDRAAVASYERLRCTPRRENAEKIAKILGVDVNYLFPPNIKKIVKEVKKIRKIFKKHKITTYEIGQIIKKKGVFVNSKKIA